MRGPVLERHGYNAASAVGRDLHDVIPASAWARLGGHWNRALAGRPCELDTRSADGGGDYWLHFAPLRTDDGLVGAIMVAQDITERVRGRDETRHRLTQQADVSALGSLALRGRPLADLFDEAARVLHETLASDMIMVLETTADGGISVRASAGETAPEPPQPSANLRRSIGLMREGNETWLSSDLRSETAFRAPGLAAAGMVSLMAAPIGSAATAYGELVACSRQPDAFSGDDLAFIESIANLLMAAVERERSVVLAAEERTLATHREDQLNDAQRLAQVGQLGHRLRVRAAHAVGEPARDARDGLLRLRRRSFLGRVHPEDRKRMRAVWTTHPTTTRPPSSACCCRMAAC